MDVLVATAGLSECAADCRAENWPFYIGFALFVLFCVWITLSMFATVDVISRHIGPRRSATWVGVVWLVQRLERCHRGRGGVGLAMSGATRLKA